MANEALTAIEARHQVLLEQLKSGHVRDFMPIFTEIESLIQDTLRALRVDKLNEISRASLEKMITTLADDQAGLFTTAIEGFMSSVPDVAKYEAEFEARAIRSVMAAEARHKIGIPSSESIAKEAIRRPVQATGHVLADFFGDWSKSAINRTNKAVRLGYENGQTVPQILKGLFGSKPLQFKDGAMEVTKKQAATVVRTAVQQVASTARQVTYEQNADVVDGYEWLSTLDSKTTPECRALDGRKFKVGEGPLPPIHPNCRSTTVPTLDKAFDFLDKGATRSSEAGYVDANLSYYDWLQTQSTEFQDHVLGPTRGTLFRDGGLTPVEFGRLQLDKNFDPITLTKMRELEPLAFERAGLAAPGSPPLFSLPSDNPAPVVKAPTGVDFDPLKLPGRPGASTATGKVWQIGDDLYSKLGRFPTRQEMLAAAKEHLINESTVGVQFGKWKNAYATAMGAPPVVPPIAPPPVKLVQAIKKMEVTVTTAIVEKEGKLALWENLTSAFEEIAQSEMETRQLKNVQNAHRDLAQFYKTHGDGQGNLDFEKMHPYDVSLFNHYQKVIKDYSYLEVQLRGSAARDLKAEILNTISKVASPDKAVSVSYASTVAAADRAKFEEAKAFIERVTASELKPADAFVTFKIDKMPAGVGAFYTEVGKAVTAPTNAPVQHLVHELGHFLEYRSKSATKLFEWLEQRRAGEKWRKAKIGSKTYEVFRDKWSERGGSDYTSRFYASGSKQAFGGVRIQATEVLSMGIERLYQDPLEFLRRDPDHFLITVRTLLNLW